jgi:hypothetical protein
LRQLKRLVRNTSFHSGAYSVRSYYGSRLFPLRSPSGLVDIVGASIGFVRKDFPSLWKLVVQTLGETLAQGCSVQFFTNEYHLVDLTQHNVRCIEFATAQ